MRYTRNLGVRRGSLAGAADLFQPSPRALCAGRVECPHGGVRAIRVRPDPGGHCKEVRAGFNQAPAIVDGDAADGDARYLGDVCPPGEDVPAGAALGGFGAGVEERTKRDIVRAGLGGLKRKMPGIMAGHADDGVVSQQSSGVCVGCILLADMNPVTPKLGGKIGAVVQDKRDIVLMSNGH